MPLFPRPVRIGRRCPAAEAGGDTRAKRIKAEAEAFRLDGIRQDCPRQRVVDRPSDDEGYGSGRIVSRGASRARTTRARLYHSVSRFKPYGDGAPSLAVAVVGPPLARAVCAGGAQPAGRACLARVIRSRRPARCHCAAGSRHGQAAPVADHESDTGDQQRAVFLKCSSTIPPARQWQAPHSAC